MNKLRIQRGTVTKLTPEGEAKVWLLKAGQQDTLYAELDAAEELILGPYLNITEFRITSEFEVTITNQVIDFSTPVSPFEYITPAASVDDAVDSSDVTDRFNDLLASLRTAGFLAV